MAAARQPLTRPPTPDPEDLPLLLAAHESAADDGQHPLDRVRMQKGVFLLTMGGPARWHSLYEFRPYNWGPYSTGLAHALDRLREDNLLRTAPVPGSRYGRFVTTGRGQEHATAVWEHRLSTAERQFVRDVRSYVTSRNFDRLLQDVYREYPEYATETLFRPWRSR